jgi:hypothetical protein
VFVTADGSPTSRFQRALVHGNLSEAEAAARELRRLSLHDALRLLVLYAQKRDAKFEHAAVRWLGRLALERRDIGLAELQVAAAALACLHGRRADTAAETLRGLL